MSTKIILLIDSTSFGYMPSSGMKVQLLLHTLYTKQ